MKGLVKLASGPGQMALMDVAERHAGAGEVRLQVRAAALCGTDVLICKGLREVAAPVILGHEFAGIVDEIGGGVTGVQLGDRVTSETDAFVCGTCVFCRAGDVQLCERRRAIGQSTDGGFAEAAVVPARGIHVLPESVDFIAGALTEPLAVAVHAAAERARVQPGEWVAVVGPGTVGLLVAQVARAIGGEVTLAGLDRHAERFRIGRDLGIGSAIRLDHPDDILAFREATRTEGSSGADIVIECSGTAEALTACPQLVRRGGRVVLVGFYGARLETPADQIVNGELSLIGSRGKRASSFNLGLQLLGDGRVDTAGLVTHSFPLAAWQEALEVAERSGTKVVFDRMVV
ncbi:MAG TPA: alcohol dehydrogenase [Chloroflexi bacterium]|nr:alcohol dehydrogenase [Chloroflexota bacterium]